MTDRELVEAIIADSSELAFRELFRRHSARVFRVALRLTANAADADDVLQETWLRAVQRLSIFRWHSSFSTWITGIAANVSRELLQRNRRWSIKLSDAETDSPVAPATHDAIDLERAVAALPAGERAAFILHDVEGFTHAQIAEQLSWSEGTSKSQLHRARRALARRLGAQQPEVRHD